MKHRLSMVALAALVVTPVVGASPAPTNTPAHCSQHAAVTKTVTLIADGVKLELASDDPQVAAGLQERVAKCECTDCPMRAAGVSRSVEKTAKGVLITATSGDAATVKKLQEDAEAKGTRCCCHAGASQKTSCPHGRPAAAAASCCAVRADVKRTVVNLDNGVKITLASDDPKVAEQIQQETATQHKPGGHADCPMHAEGVARTIDRTTTGVVITATTKDPATAKKLQEHVAGMGDKPCAHNATGCTKAKTGAAKCPHAKGGV